MEKGREGGMVRGKDDGTEREGGGENEREEEGGCVDVAGMNATGLNTVTSNCQLLYRGADHVADLIGYFRLLCCVCTTYIFNSHPSSYNIV